MQELHQYVSKDCLLNIGNEKIPLGLEGMREHLVAIKKTYPDYTIKILRQFADGDYVISEFLMEGTHEGEWIGIKPTHKKMVFTGVDIDKVINGKIVEHGGSVNTFETCHSYVVMSIGGKILVVNGENDPATKEIYHNISEKK